MRVFAIGVAMLLVTLSGCAGVAQHVAASPTPTATYCLLPTFDEGYMENPGVSPVVHCINTGAVATQAQIDEGRYAPQCYDQLSKVPCYHPCFDVTGHPKPCPDDIRPTATTSAR